MNINSYPADSVRINARDLATGQEFIHNYMGGNRTVYTAERVVTGSGQTVITYVANGMRGEFYCAPLSTLVLV